MKKQSLFILLLILSSASNAQLKVNTSGYIEIGTNPSTNHQLNIKGNSFFDGNVGIGITPSTTLKLNLAGNSFFNGNVGIGITPSTYYKLYVLGKSSFNGESNFQGLSNFKDCSIGGDFNYFPPYRTSPTISAFRVYGNDNQPALSIIPAYAFSSQYLLWVGGDSYITGSWTSSDNQLKKSVTVLDGNLMLSKIMNIDGKKFEFKNNEELEQLYKDKNLGSDSTYKNKLTNLPKGERFGFIAQDIEKEFPELVKTDSITSLKAINYEGMIPVLLQSIKEQQKMIIDLQEKINDLIVNPNQKISAPFYNENNSESSNKNTLFQNIPNPFTQSTTINYNISDSIKSAMICIYNLNGNQIRCIKIDQKGIGSVMINANELNPGIYIYSLLVDGILIDTKRMVLTK